VELHLVSGTETPGYLENNRRFVSIRPAVAAEHVERFRLQAAGDGRTRVVAHLKERPDAELLETAKVLKGRTLAVFVDEKLLFIGLGGAKTQARRVEFLCAGHDAESFRIVLERRE
jgi:hypothetical protein